MKCPKCGRISFDYLDSCMKCGEDLRPVRMDLNLHNQRPNPPFLLSPLLMGAIAGEQAPARELLPLQEKKSEESLIPIEEGISFPDLDNIKLEGFEDSEPVIEFSLGEEEDRK